MSLSLCSVVHHPGTHLRQLLPDKIYGVRRAVVVEVSIVHARIGGEKEESMVTSVPLTILLQETFEEDTPDSVSEMILANSLADIAEAVDIILKISGDPTTI